jgi:hypothetical protein
MNSLFGDYAGVTPMQTLTVMKYSNGQTIYLAALVGKRFVSASDGEAGQRLAENRIKNMTGGDKISCRGLRKMIHTCARSHGSSGLHLPGCSTGASAVSIPLVAPFIIVGGCPFPRPAPNAVCLLTVHFRASRCRDEGT